MRVVVVSLWVLLICTLCCSASNRRQDDQRLDRLFALCSELGRTNPRENCFNQPEFARESKKVAEEAGPAIIHAIMRRARSYPADQYSQGPWATLGAVVFMLPRAETTRLLKRYEHSNNKAERLWAHEYLTEFGLDALEKTPPSKNKALERFKPKFEGVRVWPGTDRSNQPMQPTASPRTVSPFDD